MRRSPKQVIESQELKESNIFTVQSRLELRPAVEAVVDDGVVHGGAHGQPHDGQVHLLDVALLEQLGEELVQ